VLSVYQFRRTNPIRFRKSLDWKINWTRELIAKDVLKGIRAAGGGWIDCATTWYWYQSKVGHAHEPLPPVEKRAAVLLHGQEIAIGN
jgi:hypothetical protein